MPQLDLFFSDIGMCSAVMLIHSHLLSPWISQTFCCWAWITNIHGDMYEATAFTSGLTGS
jgi:hypothetical protein